MTEKEYKDCQLVAIALNKIYKLGIVVFITIPIYFLTNTKGCIFWFEILFSISCLLLVFQSWHLYFDAQLFKKIANREVTVEDVDVILLRLFNKKMSSKSLDSRIKGCYKIVKYFQLLLIVHLILFFFKIAIL